MIPKTWRGVVLWLAVVVTCVVVCAAAAAQTATDAGVPRLIKFSGTLSSVSASTVGVTFALYTEQTGGCAAVAGDAERHTGCEWSLHDLSRSESR
jgi:hypothetical protein